MPLAEHSPVTTRCELTADDGRTIPAGTLGIIVHISGEYPRNYGYEVEFHFDDPTTPHGSWHLASAAPSDVTAAETP